MMNEFDDLPFDSVEQSETEQKISHCVCVSYIGHGGLYGNKSSVRTADSFYY